MKKVNVYIVVCITAISSNLLTAQEHPFHQPNWGKRVFTNTVVKNISSLDLLPEKPTSKSNYAILLRNNFTASGLQQNSIPDIPQSKMNFPKSIRSVISSSTNSGNVLPQRPASKRNG